MHQIHIGGESAEFVSLAVHGREHPDCIDTWDANWLHCEVEVAAGRFEDRSKDHSEARSSQPSISNCMSSTIACLARPSWRRWKIGSRFESRVDDKGHIDVTGRLGDDLAIGNTLLFRLALDQSYLTPVLRQLDVCCRAYPVVD